VLGAPWRAFCVQHVVGGETGVRGSGDLVAYFLCQCYRLTRDNGTLGFITTNSISQGDTRQIGLSRLVRLGASTYAANSSTTWPGTSSLEFSQIWLYKGTFLGRPSLDGEETGIITPFLKDSQQGHDPHKLMKFADSCFEGVKMQGTGFLIDKPQSERIRHTEDPIGEVVLPYFSGQDLTTNSDLSANRWTINFWDWPLSRSAGATSVKCAEDFPMCLSIVEADVKPERMAKPASSSWN
jgi:hypothetical protein